MSFRVGDHVYLRVTPLKGTKRFHVKGKLAPRFIGPFEITASHVVDGPPQLDLPPEIPSVHQIFHEPPLWKYFLPPS